MKSNLPLAAVALFTFISSFSQPSVRFVCPGDQVIAFKNGTNCTANPYTFYKVDMAGVQAAAPFYTLTDLNKEVNGIGINSIDSYLYGIEYDRSIVGTSCAFGNLHLMRYDAVGNKADLGLLPALPGGVAQPSTGCITIDGHFIYLSNDAGGVRQLSMIKNIASLQAGGLALEAQYKPIATQGTASSYADWAINPVNQKLYSYGIYNSGTTSSPVSTGTIVEIDPNTGTITTTGTPAIGEFLDASRDNFGGVYFQPNGYLYGVNINTRKLYRINVTDGSIQYVSTFRGSGQMRADMGSCTSGHLILPLHFTATEIKSKNSQPQLTWQVAEAETLSQFIIEKEQGNGFVTIGTVSAKPGTTTYSFTTSADITTVYRIRALLNTRESVYSPLLQWAGKKSTGSVTLLQNPVTDGRAQLRFSGGISKEVSYELLSSNGALIKKGKATGSFIPVSELNAGLYFLRLDNGNQPLRMLKL